MSDHLPECPSAANERRFLPVGVCVCDRLRACEARVTAALADKQQAAFIEISESRFAAGVAAARAAVVAIPETQVFDWIDREQALAAIDGLTLERHADTPTKTPDSLEKP